MQLFAEMQEMGHEQVVFCRNEAADLSAVIAIDDTTLGPALGGCRSTTTRPTSTPFATRSGCPAR